MEARFEEQKYSDLSGGAQLRSAERAFDTGALLAASAFAAPEARTTGQSRAVSSSEPGVSLKAEFEYLGAKGEALEAGGRSVSVESVAKPDPKVIDAQMTKFGDHYRDAFGPKISGGPSVELEAGGPVGSPKTGETASTAMGKSHHKARADERRAEGSWSAVQDPIRDATGQPIPVPREVDLKSGQARLEKGTQSAIPDAVSYPRGLIVDDKPMGRPLSKDRQEMIRFIEAYRKREGELPNRVAIERYDPQTGAPVQTDLHAPQDFLPQ